MSVEWLGEGGRMENFYEKVGGMVENGIFKKLC